MPTNDSLAIIVRTEQIVDQIDAYIVCTYYDYFIGFLE